MAAKNIIGLLRFGTSWKKKRVQLMLPHEEYLPET